MAVTSGEGAFFHVDRASRLRPDLELAHRPWPPELGPEAVRCLESRYPGGLSEWGAGYVLDAGGEKLVFDEDIAGQLHIPPGIQTDQAVKPSRNRITEVIWEFARLEFARDKPSRFQALFAYDDLDVACKFRAERCGDPRAPIWRVRAQHAFQCDATWLQLAVNIPELLTVTRAYWEGRRFPSGSSPIDIEHLLSGPVRVIEKVA